MKWTNNRPSPRRLPPGSQTHNGAIHILEMLAELNKQPEDLLLDKEPEVVGYESQKIKTNVPFFPKNVHLQA